jgi:hypothetical protein
LFGCLLHDALHEAARLLSEKIPKSTGREELERLGYRALSMGSMAKHITSVKMRSARDLHNWEIAPQTRGKTRSKREGNSE